ncbi:SusC/RagA family TonB-linked outer membrane protein [Niabella beijingensis]|uniref:SusC/RagA family TonB-linked outer membrane protein n=1 Tax=Niabella beijingensis TaxID=2872700 RepID=UPI001CBEAD10|nr:SusC/RagA family TonB-linked outer membrane protein [Niabella beijingensis]MBZ4187628.1 SusC/RagA family TonB-linked outer membrane protein [Niabella beijingensis]
MKKKALLGVLALLCLYLIPISQNNPKEYREITGTVRNSSGEPLSGATITNTRTGKGSVTNASGKFTLPTVTEDDKLRVSYIGYAIQFVTVKKNTELDITLKDATNELDRVVVQAYGTTSDRLRTGNISKVTAADIAKQPVMNVLNVLQGLSPGVDVVNTSGYASGVVKIEIRGRNGINPNFSSDPLYVIDGVPLTILNLNGLESYAGGSTGVNQSSNNLGPANGQSPFFNINPNDIESIEVLKDADATAIYGSRGAKGVILITTKKGKPGKTTLEMNVSYGATEITKMYDMLNTEQYVALRREALKNDGLPIDSKNAPDLVLWDTTKYTNWQKALMSGGSSILANATVSGGNTYTTFRLSGDYSSQKDLSTYSGANQRGSFSANVAHQSTNRRLRVNLSTIYASSKVNLKRMPLLTTLPPNAPSIWNADGNPNYAGWAPLDNLYRFGSLVNPYESKINNLNASLSTSYEISKGLSFKTNLGYDYLQSGQVQLDLIRSKNPKNNSKGSNQFSNLIAINQIVEPQLEYNGFIGKGKLNLLAGGSWQNHLSTSTLWEGRGYANDALLRSVNNAPERDVYNNRGDYRYAAVFGRVGYNLLERYLLNLNMRRDGSSRFGPGRQFGNFGSIGAGWIFGDEAWIKRSIPALSFGKIRASIGTTGSDDVGDYQFLSRWGFGPAGRSYNGILPLIPSSHLDSLIQWQVNYKTEVGFALGFLKDRITADISWYRTRCNNQLVALPTPTYSGFDFVTTNSPANVENTGWEIILKGKPLQSTNLNWDISFNISLNRNRLLSYPNFSASPYYGAMQLGQPLNTIRVLHYTGVDPSSGNYSFEDRNGNGKVENNKPYEDDTYFLDLTPKYFGGLNNSLTYKRWQLSFLFYFKKQIGRSVLSTVNYPGGIYNYPSIILDRWQQEGDITAIPRPSTNPSSVLFNQYKNSDGVWTDASFIRLQNLVLSYRLGETACRKLGISDCSAFFKGQNLLIISNYEGLDPEVQNFGSPPKPLILTFGISLKF